MRDFVDPVGPVDPVSLVSSVGPLSTVFPVVWPDLTVVPESVEALGAWEQLAVRTLMCAQKTAAEFACSHSVPVFEAVEHSHRLIAREALAGRRTLADDIAPGAAANILLLRGVTDLWGLWELSNHCWGDGWVGSNWVGYVLDRYRRGFTAGLLDGVVEWGLPVGFLEEWATVFEASDLQLCLDAGLTDVELRAVLVGRRFPARGPLELLAGLKART